MRLAFYGGSFDPFHNGHLAIVRELQDRDVCDEILLAPAAISPGKPDPLVGGHHRLEMTRRGVRDLAGVDVTDMDLIRPGPSYTVETLSRLKRHRPDDTLLLVVGGDAWRDFRSWREPERILRLAQIIVFPRDGGETLSSDLPGNVTVLDGFSIPVSSTAIRERLAAGRDISDSVPPQVLHYIHAHGLYDDVIPE